MEFILSCSTRYLTYSLGSEKREIPYLHASNYYSLDAEHKKRTVRKKKLHALPMYGTLG